ncbi:hypothetical protein ASF49_08215 [Methylobacterium sp. Leaf104]|uniref:hypothetical protein n=1 Tax=Methylobacterium TaxID=407 RepID=UPI0006F5DA8A|nr:hypothetical protein [Methylobacterium sp. Leaf104]KQP33842.1 hypothetical protein ASF49_08215 [Methylobacterium sp. Leaf104]MCI9879589.1 hypothetical protein [Methylobacterium goesingense]
MSRRDYVLHEWLPEHGTWLALVCSVLAGVTAPDVPGAAQALAWLGAAVFWLGFLLVLRALTWKPWPEPEAARRPYAENVVPLRPGPDRPA